MLRRMGLSGFRRRCSTVCNAKGAKDRLFRCPVWPARCMSVVTFAGPTFRAGHSAVWCKPATPRAFHVAPSLGVNKLRSVTITASILPPHPGDLCNFILRMKFLYLIGFCFRRIAPATKRLSRGQSAVFSAFDPALSPEMRRFVGRRIRSRRGDPVAAGAQNRLAGDHDHRRSRRIGGGENRHGGGGGRRSPGVTLRDGPVR
jgi:hypothetical protein